LKLILRNCDVNMHTVITDALLGTEMVATAALDANADSAMVASWTGKKSRVPNFLSPGSEVQGKLLPQADYGVNKRVQRRDPQTGKTSGYDYYKGGETRYIQSFGSMKDYLATNQEHQKRVRKMGFGREYFIPPLPLYRYEIAKFRWVPSQAEDYDPSDANDGYYEGMARIRKSEGVYTFLRLSLLTSTMELLFGTDETSEYIQALKTKSTTNTFSTQYRFVSIPPGDARETHRRARRALANEALMAAEAEERKQKKLHPSKRPKTESPAVTAAKATLLAVDAPPPAMLCTSTRIKYRQTEELTCLIDSFCSALWAFGLPKAAADLQQHHRLHLSQCNHRLIGDWINITNRNYLNPGGMVIRKIGNIHTVDHALAWDTSWPLLLVLATSDGAVGQHSVTVYRDGVYEPNAEFVLTKSRGSLDWASGDDCTCIGITKAYQIVPRDAGSLRNGPPRIFNVEGHGRGWLATKQQPPGSVPNTDNVEGRGGGWHHATVPCPVAKVRLLSGGQVTVDKTLLS
jgi:hypothetical protein